MTEERYVICNKCRKKSKYMELRGWTKFTREYLYNVDLCPQCKDKFDDWLNKKE